MKWDPNTDAYFKTCPVCGTGFAGRKNQVYCTVNCKNKHNNDKQLERRKRRAVLTEPFLRNVEILAVKMDRSDTGEIEVSMEELRVLGFDPTAPNVTFKDKGTGKVWYRYGSHAIRPDEENRKMTIVKITDNE